MRRPERAYAIRPYTNSRIWTAPARDFDLKFPGLRICASHAGGYLPSYLGRTEAACDVRPNASCANKKRPRDYFKREIIIDTMIFSDEGLRHLVAEVGVGQIVYGTDIPFNWPVGVDLVLRASFLSDAEKEAILGANAARLLKLAPAGTL